VFAHQGRIAVALQWVFYTGCALTVVALLAIAIAYGLDRQYRFEVLVISIDWLVLLISGVLVGVLFGRQLSGTGYTASGSHPQCLLASPCD